MTMLALLLAFQIVAVPAAAPPPRLAPMSPPRFVPPPLAPARYSRRALIRSPIAAYFAAADYPPSALRAGEEGVAYFRLVIDPSGRVADCAITASSGSAMLDSTTCRIVRSRARFTPALDLAGAPASDSYADRVRWTLPAEPKPEAPR
jgi:protein TonB